MKCQDQKQLTGEFVLTQGSIGGVLMARKAWQGGRSRKLIDKFFVYTQEVGRKMRNLSEAIRPQSSLPEVLPPARLYFITPTTSTINRGPNVQIEEPMEAIS